MTMAGPRSFGANLKALREAAGFTQEELATIAGLSVHAVSALERGERRRPHPETARALSTALDLTGPAREMFLGSARRPPDISSGDDSTARPLPVPLTSIVGREVEFETLRQWLADPACRLVTIVGPGGVGKTRLALELAQDIARRGETRVLYVSLAAISDAAFVAPAIAEALGLTDVDMAELPSRARVACEGRPTLLILDSHEHVLDAAPRVAELLVSVASLRLLVTSRAALHVRGEREYALGPLGVDGCEIPDTVSAIMDVPAVKLFVDRVRDVQPDFRVTAANARAVAAICRRLDALPLALELAAPWMKVLTPAALLARLERDVLLLPAGPRDLPERQQTLNATVGWSYRLLGSDEQWAFRRFGAVPGPFPIDAAEAVLAGRDGTSSVADAALRATAALIDKSLLLRLEPSAVPTCPLYYMLDTVRAYAVLELDRSGERDEALEGLARYCLQEAALAADGLVGPAQVEWLDRVREDLESHRATMTWLLERGRAAEACEIAYGLLFFWLIRGHGIEGLRWYERILAFPYLEPRAESRALVGAAVMFYSSGDLGRARAKAARALDLATKSHDLHIVAEAEHMLGHVTHALGEEEVSRQYFVSSASHFETVAVPWGAGSSTTGLAWIAFAQGDIAEAERLLAAATAALQPAGPWFLSLVTYLRSLIAMRDGDADEAIALTRQSLARIRALKDHFAFVYALVPLAAAADLKQNDGWVARLLGARDALSERTGATVMERSVQGVRERIEHDVRTRLGPERWSDEYALGRTSTIDTILQDIDAFAS